MKVVRTLNQIAAGTSSLYRIVFTGLLLFELVMYRRRARRGNAESITDNSHRSWR